MPISSPTSRTPSEPRESFGFIGLQGTKIGASLRMDVPDESISPIDYAQAITHYLLSDDADWSRVDATEDLLMHLLTFAPGDTRTPVFCFFGWLRWYKGQSSLAVAYIAQGLEEDPTHRLALLLALLLMQLLRLGRLPEAAMKPSTSYPASFSRR